MGAVGGGEEIAGFAQEGTERGGDDGLRSGDTTGSEGEEFIS